MTLIRYWDYYYYYGPQDYCPSAYVSFKCIDGCPIQTCRNNETRSSSFLCLNPKLQVHIIFTDISSNLLSLSTSELDWAIICQSFFEIGYDRWCVDDDVLLSKGFVVADSSPGVQVGAGKVLTRDLLRLAFHHTASCFKWLESCLPPELDRLWRSWIRNKTTSRIQHYQQFGLPVEKCSVLRQIRTSSCSDMLYL